MPDKPRFRRSRPRYLLFVMAAWAMVAAGAEIVAQPGFRLLPASSPIRRLVYPSRFRLQRMARGVDDQRIATLIPHYRAILTDDDYPANRPWRVTIDRNGFRGDLKHYEGKPAVVAFIGDSVPFGCSNLAALAELRDIARADDSQVILLPVNPGPEPHRVYTAREREAIERYNRLLEGFAARHVEVTFLDVTRYFERHPRRDALFVDSCCHLSEDGARAQAIYLYDAITRAQVIGAQGL
jgi:hypothetical protein